MNHIDTIIFQDGDERCEAAAIVRADANRVELALTLASDGDIQVVMPHDAAKRLHDALGKAISSDR
jgi:hypothetical protein